MCGLVPVIIQKPLPASVYVVVVCVRVCVREREGVCVLCICLIQSVYFATQSWLFPRWSMGWGKAAVGGLCRSALISLTWRIRHSDWGLGIRSFHDLGTVALCHGMWGSLPNCHTRGGWGWIPKMGVRPTTSWLCVGCFHHLMVFSVFRDGV